MSHCACEFTAHSSLLSNWEKVDCSFKYLSSKQKENTVSGLNQNQVTAWLFFIALPYSIREIESRCPQYNCRQTPGRSYCDQTDNSFLLKPYATWAHLYNPAQNHTLLNMPCEVCILKAMKYGIEFLGCIEFKFPCKNTQEILIQQTDKKKKYRQTAWQLCSTDHKLSVSTVCWNAGGVFHRLILFFLDLSLTKSYSLMSCRLFFIQWTTQDTNFSVDYL